jgi:ankyrin repeat protein
VKVTLFSMTALLLVSYLLIVDVSIGKTSVKLSHEVINNALQQAVTTNKLADVQRLLKEGANSSIIVEDKNRRSALILATARGFTEIVTLLLSSGAEVNYKDNAGLTALNWAAMRQKNAEARRLLIWYADVNTYDNNGVTPLMYAVGTHNVELIQLLAKSGANLNAISKATKMTPLLVAVEQGNIQSVLSLLDLGANLNSTNHEGYTALMAAAESGQDAILKKLVTRGAISTARDLKGMTALDYAQQYRHRSSIEFLKGLQKSSE